MSKLVYNVTVNIEDDVHEEWLEWMKKIHIPEVMSTGCFEDCRMYLIEKHNTGDPGTNYGIQYIASVQAEYERYNKEFAPELRQKAIDRFGGKFIAFRTLLHEVPLG